MVGEAAAIQQSLGLKAVASSFGDLLLPDHQRNLVVVLVLCWENLIRGYFDRFIIVGGLHWLFLGRL
jgi:hypothetical protein